MLGRRRNTSASTRIFNVALISKERRGVDLQGYSDAQAAVRGLSGRIPSSSGFGDLADKSYMDLVVLEVIGSGFGPVEMDHLYKSSVIGFMTCLTDRWFSKSSSDELFWAELMTGRITAPKFDLIGIGRLSF
ncbi:hypothetical protein PIB30_009323 [Stylosanthes scabra]|uniref:Uncharacterized protein n=1 Tax=Stylosanthes scabra TaxID=79078 RepID=A0ABU6T7B6_9FABA|nr:hypothetical protein [Stylosanthes scabra]